MYQTIPCASLTGFVKVVIALRFVEPLKEALVYVKRHLHRGNSV